MTVYYFDNNVFGTALAEPSNGMAVERLLRVPAAALRVSGVNIVEMTNACDPSRRRELVSLARRWSNDGAIIGEPGHVLRSSLRAVIDGGFEYCPVYPFSSSLVEAMLNQSPTISDRVIEVTRRRGRDVAKDLEHLNRRVRRIADETRPDRGTGGVFNVSRFVKHDLDNESNGKCASLITRLIPSEFSSRTAAAA